ADAGDDETPRTPRRRRRRRAGETVAGEPTAVIGTEGAAETAAAPQQAAEGEAASKPRRRRRRRSGSTGAPAEATNAD
ncbi:ATP-dependent helicase, partial [Micromonospora aurantiaca]